MTRSTLGTSLAVSLAPSLVAAILGLSACSGSPGAPATPAAKVPDLVGRWTSACTPSSDAQAFTLDFTIEADRWAVDYVVYGDKACSTRFVTAHIEGPYTVGGPSTAAAGAYEARFGFSKKTLTPHGAAAVAFLRSDAGCKLDGFADGVPTDVGGTGCAGLGQRPIAACPADHDLVRVDGDRITFGSRPADNDLCTEAKRPKALSPVSSRRK